MTAVVAAVAKGSKIASPPVFWCHVSLVLVQYIQLPYVPYSVSRTCSQSMSLIFFFFISRPCLLASRRATIDYSFLATYVGMYH